MSRQQRSNENLLSVPAPVTFVKQSPLTSISKRFASLNLNDKDTTDNASLPNGNGSVTNRKSFIQQRVEKLYGTTTLLVKTSSESVQLNGNGSIHHLTNGNSTNGNSIPEEKESDDDCMHSLPVMKYLRPEFCKQLQFNSPKKTSTRIVKIEQSSNGQPFKFENGTSGNTNGATCKPSKTNEILILPKNSELASEDCPPLTDPIVSCPQEIVESHEEAVINGLESINNDISANQSSVMENKLPNIELKDGHYFRKLVNNEKLRILALADEHEKELDHLQTSVSNFISDVNRSLTSFVSFIHSLLQL